MTNRRRFGDRRPPAPPTVPPPMPDPAPASVPPRAPTRVLPQYSFRTAAATVTLLALAAFVYRQAARGNTLAEAIVFAAAVILACFACYAVLFLIAWIPALIGRDTWEDVGRGSPFAAGQLPPQVLPPAEKAD